MYKARIVKYRLGLTQGFTLIELLVVIAIIAMLASIILASLSTAREKGRDARRQGDIHSLTVALELYANDHGGSYPPDDRSDPSQCAPPGNSGVAYDLTSYLTPTYISKIPDDPLNPTHPNTGSWWLNYRYCAVNDGSGYALLYAPEANPSANTYCAVGVGPDTWDSSTPTKCGCSWLTAYKC